MTDTPSTLFIASNHSVAGGFVVRQEGCGDAFYVPYVRGDRYTKAKARIAELTDAIDAFNHIDRSGRHDTADLEQLNDAVERCLRLIES